MQQYEAYIINKMMLLNRLILMSHLRESADNKLASQKTSAFFSSTFSGLDLLLGTKYSHINRNTFTSSHSHI